MNYYGYIPRDDLLTAASHMIKTSLSCIHKEKCFLEGFYAENDLTYVDNSRDEASCFQEGRNCAFTFPAK